MSYINVEDSLMNSKSESKTKFQSDKSRREFLKGAVVVGAAAAVAVSGQSAMAADDTETSSVNKAQKGYEETQHVRDYYNSARN